jgi:hypothetical protein
MEEVGMEEVGMEEVGSAYFEGWKEFVRKKKVPEMVCSPLHFKSVLQQNRNDGDERTSNAKLKLLPFFFFNSS